MSPAERVFLDAGLFIGALLSGDPRHTEARGIVEAARQERLAACTSIGVLAEVYAALTWVGALPPQSPSGAAPRSGAFQVAGFGNWSSSRP